MAIAVVVAYALSQQRLVLNHVFNTIKIAVTIPKRSWL